ncbi:hypothetical protein M0813_16451 [Anaeramoeba flamelloides]|uniref:C2H2-type domain-containing protein n=1 Tax=Anaeramoeba flamelloides TaxID=1746091 RepID=A0ABQ8YYT4_9EUKA|nr:hypothetical protein M0813_16451 [Anaeramoeba flamelloides]
MNQNFKHLCTDKNCLKAFSSHKELIKHLKTKHSQQSRKKIIFKTSNTMNKNKKPLNQNNRKIKKNIHNKCKTLKFQNHSLIKSGLDTINTDNSSINNFQHSNLFNEENSSISSDLELNFETKRQKRNYLEENQFKTLDEFQENTNFNKNYLNCKNTINIDSLKSNNSINQIEEPNVLNNFTKYCEDFLLMSPEKIYQLKDQIDNNLREHDNKDTNYSNPTLSETSDDSISETSTYEDDFYETIETKFLKFSTDQNTQIENLNNSNKAYKLFKNILKNLKKNDNKSIRKELRIDVINGSNFFLNKNIIFENLEKLVTICQGRLIVNYPNTKGPIYGYLHQNDNQLNQEIILKPNFSLLSDLYNEFEIKFLVLLYFHNISVVSAGKFIQFSQAQFAFIKKRLKLNNSQIKKLGKCYIRSISTILYRIPKQLYLKKYKIIDVSYTQVYIENKQLKNHQIKEKIVYISPIHWINYILNSSLKQFLLDLSHSGNGNSVYDLKFKPCEIVDTLGFKLRNIEVKENEILFCGSFFFDGFRSQKRRSIKNLYFYPDNLKHKHRLKNYSIFLIMILKHNIQFQNIMRQTPLKDDLLLLENGISFNGNIVKFVTYQVTGDTVDLYPNKGMKSHNSLHSCSYCLTENNQEKFVDLNCESEKRNPNNIRFIQMDLIRRYELIENKYDLKLLELIEKLSGVKTQKQNIWIHDLGLDPTDVKEFPICWVHLILEGLLNYIITDFINQLTENQKEIIISRFKTVHLPHNLYRLSNPIRLKQRTVKHNTVSFTFKAQTFNEM